MIDLKLSGCFIICCFVFAQGASVQGQEGGIPQPDVIFYGTYTAAGDSSPSTPTNVEWTLAGNSETSTSASFSIISIASETFYLSRISFEQRAIANATNLPATVNVLELTGSDTTYTRSVKVDGTTAFLPDGKGSFDYGVERLGLIERIDLTAEQAETFDEWSMRIFGRIVDPDGDEDGDGVSNRDEFLAGTDPSDSTSGLRMSIFSPLQGGGFNLEIQTVAGIRYQFEKTTALGAGAAWTSVGPARTGNGSIESFTAPPEPDEARMFYRVRVITP